MSRTGRSKMVYIHIPYKLYAAILQDVESRVRSISVEQAVQECVRARYAKAKVSREYLVRAGREIVDIQPKTGESAALHLPKSTSAVFTASGRKRAMTALPTRRWS